MSMFSEYLGSWFSDGAAQLAEHSVTEESSSLLANEAMSHPGWLDPDLAWTAENTQAEFAAEHSGYMQQLRSSMEHEVKSYEGSAFNDMERMADDHVARRMSQLNHASESHLSSRPAFQPEAERAYLGGNANVLDTPAKPVYKYKVMDGRFVRDFEAEAQSMGRVPMDMDAKSALMGDPGHDMLDFKEDPIQDMQVDAPESKYSGVSQEIPRAFAGRHGTYNSIVSRFEGNHDVQQATRYLLSQVDSQVARDLADGHVTMADVYLQSQGLSHYTPVNEVVEFTQAHAADVEQELNIYRTLHKDALDQGLVPFNSGLVNALDEAAGLLDGWTQYLGFNVSGAVRGLAERAEGAVGVGNLNMARNAAIDAGEGALSAANQAGDLAAQGVGEAIGAVGRAPEAVAAIPEHAANAARYAGDAAQYTMEAARNAGARGLSHARAMLGHLNTTMSGIKKLAYATLLAYTIGKVSSAVQSVAHEDEN